MQCNDLVIEKAALQYTILLKLARKYLDWESKIHFWIDFSSYNRLFKSLSEVKIYIIVYKSPKSRH